MSSAHRERGNENRRFNCETGVGESKKNREGNTSGQR
jgi:hypothetical protein